MAKWIWLSDSMSEDSYGDFLIPLKYDSGKVRIKLSADSDYTLYVNEKFVCSNQYRDFPYYKIYDEIDITDYLIKGDNYIAIEVWYYGIVNLSYYLSTAGIWYEIYRDDIKILESNGETQSRLSKSYVNGKKKWITSQLGLSFHYDASKSDDWKKGYFEGFNNSIVVEGITTPIQRPIKRLEVGDRADSVLVIQKDGRYTYDVGREEVGYLSMKLKSVTKQTLTISWGEHLADGCVRRIIDGRDFSVQLTVPEGEIEYTNYFRRLGGRYIEVAFEYPVDIEYIGLKPCVYPLERVDKHFDDELRDRIYDVSVRTLELCMHDHYEDCPWREQAMYAMDSRNQMLCGYYAFQEYAFPRAALLLMSKNNRKDNLLSICTPTNSGSTIPSFTLHYFTNVYEYCLYSKDLSLAREILPKLKNIISAFVDRMENGLIPSFVESCYWNFYEWRDDLCGGVSSKCYESVLNCLFSMALNRLQQICDMIGDNVDYESLRIQVNENIYKAFFNKETGLIINRMGEERYSELANSLAILCGAVDSEEAKKIAFLLANKNSMIATTLSMNCFKYDALLKIDREKYKNYILSDIDIIYKKMLDSGATSFWETENGELDFEKAGSLCHGWSAMPVYYYNELL